MSSAAHTSPLDGQECYCPVIRGIGVICGAEVDPASSRCPNADPTAAQGHSDYRDVPWWGRWIYWRSQWLRGVCRDAWSFRRLRDLEFEREDAEEPVTPRSDFGI